MTNYKTFRIANKIAKPGYVWIRFELNGCINFSDGSWSNIDCSNCFPFNEYQEGDYIEIDADKVYKCGIGTTFSDTSVIRKFSSSSVISGSSQQLTTSQFQAIGNEMMNRAQQSGGQMETAWIAREEYRTDGSVSAREMGWVYRHKK